MTTSDPHIQPTALRDNRTTRSVSSSNRFSALADDENDPPPAKSNIRSQPVSFNDDSDFEDAFIEYPTFDLKQIRNKLVYPQNYTPRQIMLSLFISLKAANDIDLFGAAGPLLKNLGQADPTLALILAVRGAYVPGKDLHANSVHEGNFHPYIIKHQSPEGYFRFGMCVKTMDLRIASYIFHWFSTTEHIVYASPLLSKNCVCIWFAFTDRMSINMKNFKDYLASVLPSDRLFETFEKTIYIPDVSGRRLEARALVFQCAEDMREVNERDVLKIKFSGRYRHVVPMTTRNMNNRNPVAVRLLHAHIYFREHRDIIRVVPNSPISDTHEKVFDALLTPQQGKTVPAARVIDTRGAFILISGYSALSDQNRTFLKTQVEQNQLDCDIYPPSTATIISSSRDAINSLPVNTIEIKSLPTTSSSTLTSSTKSPLDYSKIVQKFAQQPSISQSTLDNALSKLESRHSDKLETLTAKIDSLLSVERIGYSDVEDIVDSKLSAHDARIASLEKEVATLKQSYNEMLENNTKLNDKLDKIDTYMSSTSNQLALLSSQITASITNPPPQPVPPQQYFPPHPHFPSPSPFMTPLLPYQMDPSLHPMNFPPQLPAPTTTSVHERVSEIHHEPFLEQTSPQTITQSPSSTNELESAHDSDNHSPPTVYPSEPNYNTTPISMSSKFTYVENPGVKELFLIPKKLTMNTPDSTAPSSAVSSNSSFTTPTNSTITSNPSPSTSGSRDPHLNSVPEHSSQSPPKSPDNPKPITSPSPSILTSTVEPFTETSSTTHTASPSSPSPSSEIPPRAFQPPVVSTTPKQLPQSIIQLPLPSDVPSSILTSSHDDVSTITPAKLEQHFQPTAVLGFSKTIEILKQNQPSPQQEIKTIGDDTTTIVVPTPPQNKPGALSPSKAIQSIGDSTSPSQTTSCVTTKMVPPQQKSSSIQSIGTSTDSMSDSATHTSTLKESNIPTMNRDNLTKLLNAYRLKRRTTTDSSSYAPTNKTVDSINPTPTPKHSDDQTITFSTNPRRSRRIAKLNEQYNEQLTSIQSHISTMSNEKQLSVRSRFSPQSAKSNSEAGSTSDSASNPSLEEGEMKNE